LVDDTEAYYEDLRSQGHDAGAIANIMASETSILFQEIQTESVRSALAGDSHTLTIEGYRGERVFIAYKPLEIQDVRWIDYAHHQCLARRGPEDGRWRHQGAVPAQAKGRMGSVGRRL